MPNLHPQIQAAIAAMAKLDLEADRGDGPGRGAGADGGDGGLAQGGAAAGRARRQLHDPGPADAVRHLRPARNAAGDRHGGGHVIGGLDSHDLVAARNLCGGAEAVVVSVDYTGCFPAAVGFVLHADIGADRTSASRRPANLVALAARDQGAGAPAAIARYPVADFRTWRPRSYKTYATGCGILTADAVVPQPLPAADRRARLARRRCWRRVTGSPGGRIAAEPRRVA